MFKTFDCCISVLFSCLSDPLKDKEIVELLDHVSRRHEMINPQNLDNGI